jgi:hypothetical protein
MAFPNIPPLKLLKLKGIRQETGIYLLSLQSHLFAILGLLYVRIRKNTANAITAMLIGPQILNFERVHHLYRI